MTELVVAAAVIGFWLVAILVGKVWETFATRRTRQLDAMAQEMLAEFDVEKEKREILAIKSAYVRRSPFLRKDHLLRGRCPKCFGRLRSVYVRGRGRRRNRYIECIHFPTCSYRIAYTRSMADELLRHQEE